MCHTIILSDCLKYLTYLDIASLYMSVVGQNIVPHNCILSTFEPTANMIGANARWIIQSQTGINHIKIAQMDYTLHKLLKCKLLCIVVSNLLSGCTQLFFQFIRYNVLYYTLPSSVHVSVEVVWHITGILFDLLKLNYLDITYKVLGFVACTFFLQKQAREHLLGRICSISKLYFNWFS